MILQKVFLKKEKNFILFKILNGENFEQYIKGKYKVLLKNYNCYINKFKIPFEIKGIFKDLNINILIKMSKK